MKVFKGFKTLMFNIVAAIPIAIEVFMQIVLNPEFGDLVPDDYKGIYVLVVAVVNLVLRAVTTTPIGKAR